jgi:hypothetical protein
VQASWLTSAQGQLGGLHPLSHLVHLALSILVVEVRRLLCGLPADGCAVARCSRVQHCTCNRDATYITYGTSLPADCFDLACICTDQFHFAHCIKCTD